MRTAVIVLIFVSLAACLNLLPAAAQTKPEPPENEPETEVLSIELTCNGFPGTDQTKKTKQKIYIKDDKMFMEDTETANVFIMRGDLKKVWEISRKEKLYIERDFSYFDSMKPPKMEGGVLWKTGKKEQDINSFKCHRLTISDAISDDNDKIVLEMWLTDSTKMSPRTLINFYKRYGGFSSGKVGSMLDNIISFFPVVVKTKARFGLLERDIESRVTKVERKKISAKIFDLPKGLKRGLEAICIEQLCNGFPGTRQKKKTMQKVILKDDKIFMENLESPHVCIVRSDKKELWEINTGQKYYNKRLFEYFDKIRKENEAVRKTAVRQLNAIRDPEKRAKAAGMVGILVGKNGKVPEKPVAKTEDTGEKKKINGFDCYHIKIYEDARDVLDLWLTGSLEAPGSLMDFYRKLGCFADATVAEMAKIKGFPILLKAKLNFGTVEHEVESEIKKVEWKKVAVSQFDLPKGIPAIPEKIIGDRVIVTGKVICPVCGKQLDPNAQGKDAPIRHRHEGVIYLFDSRECHLKFVRLLPKHPVKKVLEILAREREKNKKK